VTAAVAHRRRPWRDNIEAMTMAIVMALLLKGFVVEAYKIPTGSMQPTLIGDEEAGIQDRILVDKLAYVIGEPKRWDVAVFKYPLNTSQNFVKRIVGVGPEEFRIHNGDLWNRADASQPWRILRRSARAQESAWLRLDLDDPPESSWRVVEGGERWERSGRAITARGDGIVGFRTSNSTVQDRTFDGYPEAIVPLLNADRRGRRGANPVGDLALEGEAAALGGTRWIRLDLREGHSHYRFSLPGPAAPDDARPSIEVVVLGHRGPNEEPPPPRTTEEPWRLEAGRSVRFRAQNLDDLLSFSVEGAFALEQEIPQRYDQESAVRIELEGEGADFEDIMVYRDIYYRAEGRTQTTTIPAGHYFMLGDNTRNSSDSREWFFDVHRIASDGGEPRILRTDGCRRDDVYPVTIDGRRHRLLVDEFGERAWIPSDELEVLRDEDVPFVPRSMVQGKALAVFWPLDPLEGIYRLSWVR